MTGIGPAQFTPTHGVSWVTRAVLPLGAAAGLALLNAASVEASVGQRDCGDLKGAAAQVYGNGDTLCKNLLGEFGSSNPDVGRALKESARGSRTAPERSGNGAARAPKRSTKPTRKGGARQQRPVTGHSSIGAHGEGRGVGVRRRGEPKDDRPKATPTPSQVPYAPSGLTVPRGAGPEARAGGPRGGVVVNSAPASGEEQLAWQIGKAGLFASLLLVAGLVIVRRPPWAFATGLLSRRRASVPLREMSPTTSAPEKPDPPVPVGRTSELPQPRAAELALGCKDLASVKINLTEAGGLGLTGPGAAAAARVLLHRCVVEGMAGHLYPMAAYEDLATLLDMDVETVGAIRWLVLDADGQDLDGVVSSADELARYQIAVDEHCARVLSQGGKLTPAEEEEHEPCLPKVLFTSPTSEAEAGRLHEALLVGARYGNGAVLLGTWSFGTTVSVSETGRIMMAEGPGADGLVGTVMDQIDAEELRRLLGVTGDDEDDQHGHLADEADVPTAASVGSPSGQAAVTSVSASPGLVRLLGQCSVAGSRGDIVGDPGKDAWALLGLLAEYRTSGLSRETVYGKLWPDQDPRSDRDRFWGPMKEARAMLSEAMGASTISGTQIIENLGRSMYRVNPAYMFFDVWRLRDALIASHAATGSKRIELLAEAADLYTGRFLTGCPHEFVEATAQSIEREIINVLSELADTAEDPERAVTYLERATGLDGTAEHLYRQRMEIYSKLGRTQAIHRCYDDLCAVLRPLDIRPDRRTTDTFRRLTRG